MCYNGDYFLETLHLDLEICNNNVLFYCFKIKVCTGLQLYFKSTPTRPHFA